MTRIRPAIGAASVMLLLLAGCSKAVSTGSTGSGSSSPSTTAGASASSSTTSSTGAGGVKTGPGVTASTIKIGALLDLTNVFAPNSKSIVQGLNTFWKHQNATSKVCGRTVQLDVQNTNYDPQTAIAAYRGMAGNVLAISTVLGSPVVAALQPSFTQDNMFAQYDGWSSDVLSDPHIQVVGSTYDTDMISAVDWLVKNKGLKAGDSVGDIYFQGDFGNNALQGTEFAAKKHGLKVVKEQITPAVTDLTTQVTQLKQAGVKAILLSAANPQTASVATVAASLGLNVPIVGNAPIFTPELLGTPAAGALEKNVYVVSSIAPPSLNAPAVNKFRTELKAAYPSAKPIQNASLIAYAQAQLMATIMDKACASKNLTRQGILDAAHSLTAYNSGGALAGLQDFSRTGHPSGLQVYMSKVTAGVPGGLKAVGQPFESPLVKEYEVSK